MLRYFPPRAAFGKRNRHAAATVALMGLIGLSTCANRGFAVTLQFNYDYDTTGFFGTTLAPTPARMALENAGRAFGAFTDDLAAIQPGGGNSWTARFFSPATGSLVGVSNLVVPQDTLVVFAGARDLDASRLGEGGFGGYLIGAGAAAGFQDAVATRGQTPAASDFAPWGGAIVFDTHRPVPNEPGEIEPRNWHYDIYSAPALDAFDFYSVAVHELTHLMGFGVAQAFTSQVSNNFFTGPEASALNQGSVPMAGTGHWSTNVFSPPFIDAPPKAAMGPALGIAERKTLTPIDYAALSDTGWEVPPPLLGLTGDADGDDDVDGADYLAWQRNLGGFGGSLGDVNGDLLVDDLDGWLIRRFMGGRGPGSIPPPGAPVPEPTAFALAAALAAFALRRLRPGAAPSRASAATPSSSTSRRRARPGRP